MRLRDQISMARRNLRRQKGRTRLTLLSIIIGAFAVISVIILSFTANQAVANYFEQTGELYNIDVRTVGGGDEAIDDKLLSQVEAISGVESYTPTVGLYEYSALRFEEQNVNLVGGVSLVAERPNGTRDHALLAGRLLTDSDTGAQALVSEDMAAELTGGNAESLVGGTMYLVTQPSYRGPDQSPENCDFGDGQEGQDPVCQAVDIPISVVGIVQGSLSVFFPLEFGVAQRVYNSFYYDERCDPDSEFWRFEERPFEAEEGCSGVLRVESYNQIGERGYDGLRIRAASDDAINGVTTALSSDLGIRYRLDTQGEGQLEFSVGRDTLREIQELAAVAGLIFLLVGGISLLVSAIGVVNTMTMATLERTREIGVMRALGASRSDVTRVFTVESGLLGFLGGLWGFILAAATVMVLFFATGGLASLGLGFTLELPLLLTAIVPAASVVLLTTIIGIFAGVMPARRAAKLNPVDSLRAE